MTDARNALSLRATQMTRDNIESNQAPSPPNASPHLSILALTLLTTLFLLCRARFEPPSPRAVDAAVDRFSATRALNVLDTLQGDGAPHPVGTRAHELVLGRIQAELLHLGYAPEIQKSLAFDGYGGFAALHNVIARHPGRTNAKAVLLCAHYDSVPAGPGAGDDGAGVAAVLEIARALRASPISKRPVMFLLDDGEELGLQGARAFLASPLASEIDVVVNLDARGTCGPSAMFESSEGNADLVRLFAQAVERPSAVSAAYEIYRRMPNDTDLTLFKRAGLAGFNFAFIGGLERYHTPLDDLAHLSQASLQHHGDNALALVRALANETVELHANENAVYADVLGWTLVHWPEPATIPFALILVAIVSVCVWRCVAKRLCSAQEIALGVVCSSIVMTSAAAIGFLLNAIASTLRGSADPAPAHPFFLRMACFAAVFASVALVASIFARRAGVLGAALGNSIVLAAIGLAIAIAVPSASYLLLLPLTFDALALLAYGWPANRRTHSFEAALVLAPLAVAALFWFPLIEAFELGFGFKIAAVITASLGILGALTVPALIGAGREVDRRLASFAAAVAVIACTTSLLVAPRSVDRPAALSFAHFQDSDSGEAQWFARDFTRALPEAVLSAAAFSRELADPPPWSRRSARGFFALAPKCAIDPPSAVILAQTKTSSGRYVRVHLHHERVARAFVVELPANVQLAAIDWLDQAWIAERAEPGVYTFSGFSEDGFDLGLRVEGDTQAEIVVHAISSVLPEEARPLLEARPRDCVPRGEGDVSVVTRRVKI